MGDSSPDRSFRVNYNQHVSFTVEKGSHPLDGFFQFREFTSVNREYTCIDLYIRDFKEKSLPSLS
jgi:hypothetical protein